MGNSIQKTLMGIGVMLLTFNIQAQEINKDDIQYLQNLLGAEKRQVMQQLVPEADEKFWQVYEKYEADRKKIGLKRLDLINKYSTYIDNQKVKDQIILDATKLFKKNDALITKYFKKIKKAGGSQSATTFVKIEKYILSSINAQIMSDLILLEL